MSDAERTPGATPPPGGTSLTLLQRLRTNEPDAWREMVYLYTPLVYRWCAGLGVRGADADDVSQEVFRGAAAGLAGFRRERAGDSFRGWLRGITRNVVLLHFRRRGRSPQASGDTAVFLRLQDVVDPASLPADEDDPPAELEELHRRALELVRREFEERTWHAFWQTVAEGRPSADVAADLGVTPAAVRKARSRVLHRLKEEFGDLIW
jgi:RNA polymerase sigma-70 factor (ECF subfamily)